MRVLIVDDETLARSILREHLAKIPGVEIVGEAANGTEAVRAIAAERPDLVFLDVQMPGLDGFDVLRATASIHQPFVVFVTAHDEHAIRAFEVQAVDYVLKPVIETRFREAVRRAITRLRGESTADIARQMAQFLERVAPAPARSGRIAVKRDGRVNFVRIEIPYRAALETAEAVPA